MKKNYITPAVHVIPIECKTNLLDYSVNDYDEKDSVIVGDGGED